MKINRHALIRFLAIDQALRDTSQEPTLEDLIQLSQDALRTAEGEEKSVSKRTTQLDLQYMRSTELGFNAPIVVKDRKYYAYSDPDYTLTGVDISVQDQSLLEEAQKILKQYGPFSGSEKITAALSGMNAYFSGTEVEPITPLPEEKSGKKKTILFSCSKKTAQQLMKNPIHRSQVRVEKSGKKNTFSIEAPINDRLEKTLLSYGSSIVIRKPKKLRQKMENFYAEGYLAYQKK